MLAGGEGGDEDVEDDVSQRVVEKQQKEVARVHSRELSAGWKCLAEKVVPVVDGETQDGHCFVGAAVDGELEVADARESGEHNAQRGDGVKCRSAGAAVQMRSVGEVVVVVEEVLAKE